MMYNCKRDDHLGIVVAVHMNQNNGGISIMAKQILLVIDVQNDFITCALKNEAAIAQLPNLTKFVTENKFDETFVTMDTHGNDYLKTLEGKNLPVPHCIKGTHGWQMPIDFKKALYKNQKVTEVFEKPTFGSTWLAANLKANNTWDNITTFPEDYEFTIIGFCTDICVVSNALMLRAYFPNSKITVRKDCVAGVTPESNEAALLTMKMCQIEVI